jgi:hypothetical protein
MQNGRQIGYARVDTIEEIEVLRSMTDLLYKIGSCHIFTDVSSITGTLEGLLSAVSKLQISDVLIYPEDCLRNLTVGDLQRMFGHTPDGTTLRFFERLPQHDQLNSTVILGIRLVQEPDLATRLAASS